MLLKLIIALLIISIYTKKQNNITYLALGDSYTIGQSVNVTDRFPVQLHTQLSSLGYNISDPEIIAKTGWTTGELLNEINFNEPAGEFSFVTLLIGVNNQYRGGDPEVYRDEFIILLNKAISYTSDPQNVIVISIPDWGVTPFAINSGRDPNKIRSEIDLFNEINKAEANKLGCPYINITDISRDAANDLSLLAGDGLHPSGKMYSLWVEKMLDTVKNILDSNAVTIEDMAPALPKNYHLFQNYPNPFNPSTTIKYSIPTSLKSERTKVRLVVYDNLGSEITILVNNEQTQGNYRVEFDGSELTSGIYFYRLQAGEFVQTKKMLLMK